MKSINKNKLYRALLLVFLSLSVGISIAAEETPAQDTISVSDKTETTLNAENTQTPTATPQAQEPSLTGSITSLAVYNVSQSISASLANGYRDTIFHPAAFVAGSVASSFVRNAYAKYNAGKLFNSGWGVLIPEDIKNTIDVYSKNKVMAPVMIVCALGPVWSYYAGISPIYSAIMGVVFWSLAQK